MDGTRKGIEGRTWTTSLGITSFIAEPTEPSDTEIMLSIYLDGDGASVLLTPEQVRSLIADLAARVELITRPALHGTNWDGEPF